MAGPPFPLRCGGRVSESLHSLSHVAPLAPVPLLPLLMRVFQLFPKVGSLFRPAIIQKGLAGTWFAAKALLIKNNNGNNTYVNASSGFLEQNTLQPARGNIIDYGVPKGAATAQSTLNSRQGQPIRTFANTSRGSGQVNMYPSVFSLP